MRLLQKVASMRRLLQSVYLSPWWRRQYGATAQIVKTQRKLSPGGCGHSCGHLTKYIRQTGTSHSVVYGRRERPLSALYVTRWSLKKEWRIYLQYLIIIRSRGSSVSTVSDYGLDERAGVRSPAGAKDFSSSLCVQIGSGVHPASCPMGTGFFPRG
jgi:hypothetical protein